MILLQGTCDTSGHDNNEGICICRSPFFGTTCEKVPCPAVGGVACSGHGTCHAETGLAAETKLAGMKQLSHRSGAWGFCQCRDGYSGVDCSAKSCASSADGLCSRRGWCNEANGECECPWPFHGSACELKHCHGKWFESTSPKVVHGTACMNRGTCDDKTGTCVCNDGYSGNECEMGNGEAAIDL